LDHHHVNPIGRPVLAAADLPYLLGSKAQKLPQRRKPLVEQLATVGAPKNGREIAADKAGHAIIAMQPSAH